MRKEETFEFSQSVKYYLPLSCWLRISSGDVLHLWLLVVIVYLTLMETAPLKRIEVLTEYLDYSMRKIQSFGWVWSAWLVTLTRQLREPFLLVYFFVVSWLTFKGNLHSESATLFFSPLIYLISGPLSSSICLHINTLPVLKALHVRFLWSV